MKMEKVCVVTGVGPGTGTALIHNAVDGAFTRAEGSARVLVAIDAVIDVPGTRQAMPDPGPEFFARLTGIARECFHVAHQPRSTWTFDVMIRPFGEAW
ncbi:MAG: hypothetical protein ACI9QQ_000351 [Myxococcota bacterium]|jgi:hypothetical protein